MLDDTVLDDIGGEIGCTRQEVCQRNLNVPQLDAVLQFVLLHLPCSFFLLPSLTIPTSLKHKALAAPPWAEPRCARRVRSILTFQPVLQLLHPVLVFSTDRALH